MTGREMNHSPEITLHEGEPVFSEPWEAQAFAMAVSLHQNGVFGWDEWAAALSAEIHSGVDRPYYRHWLTALEKLAAQKGLTSASELVAREQAWHDAAAATPHGAPIILR